MCSRTFPEEEGGGETSLGAAPEPLCRLIRSSLTIVNAQQRAGQNGRKVLLHDTCRYVLGNHLTFHRPLLSHLCARGLSIGWPLLQTVVTYAANLHASSSFNCKNHCNCSRIHHGLLTCLAASVGYERNPCGYVGSSHWLLARQRR